MPGVIIVKFKKDTITPHYSDGKSLDKGPTSIEKLDTKNREIWMIGDTKLDLIAAKAANINSIGVLSGYDKLETLKMFTNVILNDALEAVGYLKNRKK